MALARVKTWNPGDTLTAADLNAEFNNILNNPTSLINLSAAGDVAIVSSAAAVTRLAIGTAPQALTVSTGLLPVWSAPVLQSYLSGCQITAITQTSSGTITHSSGIAVDSTSNTISMVLSSALIGTTTGAFIAGNAQPKLQVSPLAASTSYHIYVMSSVLGGSVDVLYSSSTSPTLPTGYSKQRRVGSFFTGSTGNITAMTQDGDYFWYATPPALDFSANNPGTAAVTRTIAVPSGVSVTALMVVGCIVNEATAVAAYFSDLTGNDVAPSASATPLGQHINSEGAASGTDRNSDFIEIRTSNSQIRSRLSASSVNILVNGVTYGWIDTRGRYI